MPPEAEPSLNERAFVLQALCEDIRLDGRALDEFRPARVEFGNEYGVADVTLGKTRVLCRVSAEVTQPFPDRKFDGIFTISTELSPMASPAFEVGRQTDTEILLSRLLEKALRRSGALDTEALCIQAGRRCWAVRADLHVLSHDGGLVDAGCLAALAALRHFRRPEVEVHGGSSGRDGGGDGDVRVFHPRERTPVPLALLHHPLCATVCFFHFGDGNGGGGGTSTATGAGAGAGAPKDGGGGGGGGADEGSDSSTRAVVDATLLEQMLSSGEMVVTANASGEVCQVAKLGGVPTDAVTLLNCIGLAVAKIRGLAEILDAALEKDATARDVGGLIAELSAENQR